MEFTVEKSDLFPCLALAQNITNQRTTMPILSHVLLNASSEELTLSVTDLEIGLVQYCPIKTKEKGIITLEVKKLHDVIKEFSDARITFRLSEKGWVEVKSGKSRFRFASLDPKEFPVLAIESERIATVTLPRQTLRDMIAKTTFAAVQDISKFLSGTRIEIDAQHLRMVASDGIRLAYTNYNVTTNDSPAGALLPRKGMIEARRLLEKGAEEIILMLHQSSMTLQRGTTALTMRLVEGDFPDYQEQITRKRDYEIKFQRTELLSALKRLFVLTTERSRSVVFALQDEIMIVSINTQMMGEGAEEIAIDYDGDATKLGFNAKFLIDVLEVLEEEQLVLQFTANNNSCVIRPVNDLNFVYLIASIPVA